MRRLIITLILVVMSGGPAGAVSVYSVASLTRGCEELVKVATDKDADRVYDQGICAGTIRTVLTMIADGALRPRTACIPQTMTVGRAAVAVLKFARDHPRLETEELSRVALRAITAAWPCPSGR